MGQVLSEPITVKGTSSCQNSRFKVGSSCMQGWRATMEDSHTTILSLPEDSGAAFFAVYDGHGGSKIAEYASKHLHKYITNHKDYKEGHIPEAIKQAFLELDKDMLEEENLKKALCGTTAITVLIKDDKLYCGNVGDSRAVGYIGGKNEGVVVKLSEDHKPNSQKEVQRIVAAGGWVEFNRVNGNLALTRALGDYNFKKNRNKKPEDQVISAYPDVTVHTITPEWDFVVIACDGIWDVMSTNDVCLFVREKIANNLEPEEICEELMMKCLAPDLEMGGFGCDNMTVIIVTFLHEGSHEDLIIKCERSENVPIVTALEKMKQETEEVEPSSEEEVEPSSEEEVKIDNVEEINIDNVEEVNIDNVEESTNDVENDKT